MEVNYKSSHLPSSCISMEAIFFKTVKKIEFVLLVIHGHLFFQNGNVILFII